MTSAKRGSEALAKLRTGVLRDLWDWCFMFYAHLFDSFKTLISQIAIRLHHFFGFVAPQVKQERFGCRVVFTVF
jgi:hypothetical protein